MVLSWERMLKDQPDFPQALAGLAEANAAVKAAKSIIESGRTHSERLQTAVTRQTQALKEFNRTEAEHSALVAQVDDAASRLAVAVASLSEAQETLVSLQVEGAGPQPVAPGPAMQVGNFLAVLSEIATRLGWPIGDPIAFGAMAAAVVAQSGALAAGHVGVGFGPGLAPAPATPTVAAPIPAAAAPGAMPATQAGTAPFGCPRQWGPTPRQEPGSGSVPWRRSRSHGPARRSSNLDSHFNTTGIHTPAGGAWAPLGRPPLHAADASGFSTPQSQRSRSRSPLPTGPVIIEVVGTGSSPTV